MHILETLTPWSAKWHEDVDLNLRLARSASRAGESLGKALEIRAIFALP
jgi:hypothetical protein